MENKYHQLILEKYRNKKRDINELFKTILSIGDEVGLERVLGYLEKCVMERRASWLDDVLNKIEKSENLVEDEYRIFYEKYLGIAVPREGEIVEKTDKKLVMKWWNYCPVLEACKKFGLDMRVV